MSILDWAIPPHEWKPSRTVSLINPPLYQATCVRCGKGTAWRSDDRYLESPRTACPGEKNGS